ncbi:MAG: response regulator, partial [Planctomycetes bacterium]|nr:response regulator [Planctomycetota bacterium]
HILLVEDEPSVLSVAGRILRSEGHTVTAFTGGQEALEFYRLHHDEVDVVILDAVLPKMDGRQLIRHLAEIDTRLRAVVLAAAAGGATCPPQQNLAAIIEKPFSIRQLAETVRDVLAD